MDNNGFYGLKQNCLLSFGSSVHQSNARGSAQEATAVRTLFAINQSSGADRKIEDRTRFRCAKRVADSRSGMRLAVYRVRHVRRSQGRMQIPSTK